MPVRILVVDDSPTIRRVVSQVLRQGGYDVSTAENGDTACSESRKRCQSTRAGRGSGNFEKRE